MQPTVAIRPPSDETLPPPQTPPEDAAGVLDQPITTHSEHALRGASGANGSVHGSPNGTLAAEHGPSRTLAAAANLRAGNGSEVTFSVNEDSDDASEPAEGKPKSPAVVRAESPLAVRAESPLAAQAGSPLAARAGSPDEADYDDKMENLTDLQFKKKDFRRLRTQLFQLVLSTASLKLLKQLATSAMPVLQRNHSTVSTHANSKNFQSFIQAPVLLSVTNLRAADEVEIGQQLPFDHRTDPAASFDLRLRQNSQLVFNASVTKPEGVRYDASNDDDDDTYKEETTLQQQKLTLNALKKLSLSLAPIIRSDDDDQELQPRQLTLRSLNSSPHSRPKIPAMTPLSVARSEKLDARRPKPYQPAQVDLSQFSSLTRQSKYIPDKETTSPVAPAPPPSELEREYHNTIQQQMMSLRNQAALQEALPIVQPPLRAQRPIRTPAPLNAPQSLQTSTSPKQNGKPQPETQGRTSPGFGQFVEHRIGGKPVAPQPKNWPKSPTGQEPAPRQQTIEKRLQQINSFRSPMYIPAVLRRTEDRMLEFAEGELYLDQTLASAIPTPPVNGHGNVSTASGATGASAVGSPGNDATSSATSIRSVDLNYSADLALSQGVHSKTGPFTLNKKQYEYILRAAPSRRHWLKDESVVECGLRTCNKKFNFFERRHHCRRCGGIFCKEHTSHYLYINHLAQFTTGGRGTLSRVCDNCIGEYNEFMKHEFGVSSVPLTRETPQAKDKKDFRKEIFAMKAKTPVASAGDDRADPVVGSVPANWSWSSF